jgi:hypothetical protein
MCYYKTTMTRRKKSKRSSRKQSANQKLSTLFKMSREQLRVRKTTGGGLHKTQRDMPRSEMKRRALRDQADLS